jgi:hypothetical protein
VNQIISNFGIRNEGGMRVKHPYSDWPDKVVEAGEAYFVPSSPVLEKAGYFELDPAHALGSCMDATQKAVLKMTSAGVDATPSASE